MTAIVLNFSLTVLVVGLLCVIVTLPGHAHFLFDILATVSFISSDQRLHCLLTKYSIEM